MAINIPITHVINHLLRAEPAARQKLSAHQGKVASLNMSGMTVSVQVDTEGLLKASDLPAHVSLSMRLTELPMFLQNPQNAIRYVKIEGDAEFAQTLSSLAQTLRWDMAGDLSQWVGNIAAMRITRGLQSARSQFQISQRKMMENMAEYWIDENPMLVRCSDAELLTNDVITLRDDLERLMKRIESIERTGVVR